MNENSGSKLKTWLRRLGRVGVVVTVLLGGAYGLLRWYVHHRYPYGWSHCCIKGLGLGLHNYATTNGGFFPRGEATPEASLSLLSRKELSFTENPRSAVELLRGKTVPAERVLARLAAGELLDPDTCGWHYVEGLTLSDNHELAIVWDKVGLNHNGERLPDGGHEVLFLDGTRRVITGKEWPEFLERQNQLLEARSVAAVQAEPDLVASVKLPDGSVVDQFERPWTLWIKSTDGAESRQNAGHSISQGDLRWYDLKSSVNDVPSRKFIFKLSLGDMISQPVEVEVSSDSVTPGSIVFEMHD